MHTNNESTRPSAFPLPPSPEPLQPPAPSPLPPSSKRGRPRVLDDVKRREICALVAGGCSLHEAARYIGCGINTIRRELERNAQFKGGLRRSQMYAQLSPLRAMQQAVGKHWRAAAWMLERAYPERFARRDPATLNARQARRLLNEVIDIVRREIRDPYTQAQLVKRLKPAFEDSIRAARDSGRTSRELREALEFLDHRDMPTNPARPCDDDAQAAQQEPENSHGQSIALGAWGNAPELRDNAGASPQTPATLNLEML
jgi:hypothetical protein